MTQLLFPERVKERRDFAKEQAQVAREANPFSTGLGSFLGEAAIAAPVLGPTALSGGLLRNVGANALRGAVGGGALGAAQYVSLKIVV